MSSDPQFLPAPYGKLAAFFAATVFIAMITPSNARSGVDGVLLLVAPIFSGIMIALVIRGLAAIINLIISKPPSS